MKEITLAITAIVFLVIGVMIGMLLESEVWHKDLVQYKMGMWTVDKETGHTSFQRITPKENE
jgi:hypothetical protein